MNSDMSDGMADLMLYKFKKYLGSVSREIQNRRLRMSMVSTDTTVTLSEEEKATLKSAIEICKEIAKRCNYNDMFVDASNVFYCICDSYKDGELPNTIHIYE